MKSSGKVILALALLSILACSTTFPVQVAGSGNVQKNNSTLSTTSNSTTSNSTTSNPDIYRVTGLVNVRECPSTTCRVIGSLEPNKVVEEAYCGSGNWCRIKFSGKNAWVYAPCLGQKGVCK